MRVPDDNEKKIIETINGVLAAFNFDKLEYHAATNGAEYKGSCVRCHQTGGDSGSQHFKVWPHRLLRGELVFYCRECYKTDDPSQHWTGDLIQFLTDTLKISKYKAMELLELDPMALQKVASKPLTPTMSLHGAPNDTWQKRATELIEECIAYLWSEQGKKALRYLMEVRKLTEKTIREAKLGYQPDDNRWEDAELWGLDGSRLRIHQGIVIPGLHYHPASRLIETWSITIRRAEANVIAEAVERNVDIKKVARYMLVRGSENNVLYSESVVNKWAIIVEGPFNGLSIIQEGHGEFGACVTQGTGGGHGDILAMRVLSQSLGGLVSLDPDEAGRKAAEYWTETIEHSIEHESIDGDVNDMHQRGHDLYQWMCEGRDLHIRSMLILASLQAAHTVSVQAPIQSIVEADTEPLVTVSEPIVKCGYVDKATGEVCQELKDVPHVHASHHYCERCMALAPAWRKDRNEFYWCDQHFMCWQLMETGALAEYCALFVSAGKGFVGLDADCNKVFEEVPHCGVRAGLQHYFNFCNSGHPAQISLAYEEACRMIKLLAVKIVVVPVVVEPVEIAKKPVSIFELAETAKRSALVKNTCIYQSVITSVDAKKRPILKLLSCKNVKHYGLFCDGHKSNADFLALGESFGYPSVQINTFVTLEAGYKSWLNHVIRRTEAQLTGYGYTREHPSVNPEIVPDLPAITALFKQYS